MGQYVKQVTCFIWGGSGGTYYSAWYACYSCGANVSLHSTVTQKRTKKEKVLHYPEGITFDPEEFTLDVKKWLYSAHIYDKTIEKYSIGCIPDKNAVCLPIIINRELKNYSLRYFGDTNRKYKYITRGSKKAAKIVLGKERSPDTLVIVEDYLSCIRVADYLPCFCLQGTNVSDRMLNTLIKKYNTILIWTDDDEGGDKAARTIETQIRKLYKNQYIKNLWEENLVDIRVKRIKSKVDPKLLSEKELYEKVTKFIT